MLSSAAAVCVCIVCILASLASGVAGRLDLWRTDYTRYPACFRQPVLLRLSSVDLIALAEGRNNTFCSGLSDGAPSSIHVRTSNDAGASWTDDQTLFTGNVDYLGGVVDADKQTAHIFVQQGRASVLYAQSRDGGLSWSPLTPMSSATLSIPVGLVAIPSVANGIQLRGDLCAEPTCGGAAGNLVMPFVCLQSALAAHASQRAAWPIRDGGACAGCFSCLAVSEDRGATWNIAPAAVSAQQGTREASVAQLLSGAWPLPPRPVGPTVFVSERNMGATAPGSRLHALSVDGGRSFDSTAYGADAGLPDSRVTNWTGIVAGLARFDSAVDGAVVTRRLVVSVPRSRTARADLVLFTSVDEGRTWDAGRLWAPGPAGYSCVVQLNETSGAILFENGDTEFAERISFQTFSAADLGS